MKPTNKCPDCLNSNNKQKCKTCEGTGKVPREHNLWGNPAIKKRLLKNLHISHKVKRHKRKELIKMGLDPKDYGFLN